MVRGVSVDSPETWVRQAQWGSEVSLVCLESTVQMERLDLEVLKETQEKI